MHNSDDQKEKDGYRGAVGADRESQKAWTQELVLKYASLGYNQVEIAEAVDISQPQVSRTLTALRKQAQKDIEHHIKETLPLERKKALMLFENVKKRALDISNQEKVGDRDRIAALSLAKDAAKEIWALQSEGRHIQSAIKVAGGLQEKLESIEETKTEEQEELRLYNNNDQS